MVNGPITGICSCRWAWHWKNRKSVELLHFPPDYSLTQAQDYLESKTTDRWATLLTANGIPDDQTPGYQTIIDIAPIAAPSSAGKDLEGVYNYFKDYQTTMVKEVSQNASGAALPMVAFGAPVRNWIKQQYGPTVDVLGLATITPSEGVKVPVLGSNHPSYIWYAADPEAYSGSDAQAKADAAGLKVMGQDLSAACWQAGMGSKPGTDPTVQLKSCTQTWQVTQKEKNLRTVLHLDPQPDARTGRGQMRNNDGQIPAETAEEPVSCDFCSCPTLVNDESLSRVSHG